MREDGKRGKADFVRLKPVGTLFLLVCGLGSHRGGGGDGGYMASPGLASHPSCCRTRDGEVQLLAVMSGVGGCPQKHLTGLSKRTKTRTQDKVPSTVHVRYVPYWEHGVRIGSNTSNRLAPSPVDPAFTSTPAFPIGAAVSPFFSSKRVQDMVHLPYKCQLSVAPPQVPTLLSAGRPLLRVHLVFS